MEKKTDCDWIKLPVGMDFKEFIEMKPGDKDDLLKLNAAYKNKKQTGRPVRDAILFGLALAVGIVLVQFGFYKAGIVGRDFLSVNVQMSIGSAPPGSADKVPDKGGK